MPNSIFIRSLCLLIAALFVVLVDHVSAKGNSDGSQLTSGVAHMSVPEIEEAVLVQFSFPRAPQLESVLMESSNVHSSRSLTAIKPPRLLPLQA